MALPVDPSLEKLRHQIGCVINAKLVATQETVTAADTAEAAAYVAKRKATLIIAGQPSTTGAVLPNDNLFLGWVTAGGAEIADADLTPFIMGLIGQFMNPKPLNITP